MTGLSRLRFRLTDAGSNFSLATMLLLTALVATWLGLGGRTIWRPTPHTSASQREVLATFLRDLDWVDEVNVACDERQGTIEAIVTVLPHRGEQLKPQQIDTIRLAAKEAVPGIAGQNVTVVDLNAGASYRGLRKAE